MFLLAKCVIISTIMSVSIAIIVCNGSEESEVIVPTDLWRRAGLAVTVLSVENKKNLILQNGVKISCDDLLSKENLSKYRAIYLPGGKGCKTYLEKNCEKLVKFLTKNVSNQKNWLLAACAAPAVIAKMKGIIDKTKATCYPGYEKALNCYVNKDVVCDKNFISTRACGTIFDFALTVIAKFISPSKAKLIAKEICYHTKK